MAKKKISLKTINSDYIFGLAWECEEPIGTFFIATGMEEYAERYDDFAKYLNSQHFNVYSLDYYGQGENVEDLSNLGIVPRSFFSKSVRILDDLIKKYRIKNKPVVVFGHSMGSFIIQDYIQRYPKNATHAIIMGSNGDNAKASYSFGYQLARLICKIKGEEKPAKFLKSLAIGKYTKSIKNRKTDCDWLSYNEENVQKYINDPKCGHPSSNGFYRELIKGNHRLYKKKFLLKISHDVKILIASGERDPVGLNGKGPKALEKMYKKLGVKNVSLHLYKNMRHEILKEKEHQKVYEDIIKFIKK